MTIQHADRAGLRISLSDHVSIRDCTFADNGTWGLFTDFSDYTLVGGQRILWGGGRAWDLYQQLQRLPTIRRNRLHDNHGCGLHMNGDISMGGDGVISYALVEGNIIYENGVGGGSGINMDGVTNSIVRNNLLYDNHASGISIYQIDGGSGSTGQPGAQQYDPHGFRRALGDQYTERFWHRKSALQQYRLQLPSLAGELSRLPPGALDGFASDYNIVMDRFSADDGDTRLTLAEWQAMGYDTHSIIADPAQLFVNPVAGNYHLLSNRPGSRCRRCS